MRRRHRHRRHRRPDAAHQPPHQDDGDDSYLASHWELDPAHKRGSFAFRPHNENYLLATYNTAPNNAPYRQFQSLTTGAGGLTHRELAFQLGFKLRFVNLGLLHQPNGQGSTLSRSWNRAYAQFGFERGDFTLLARIWKRFNESAESDDDPAIVDYMGRGDLLGTYRRDGHEYSLLLRRNFQTGKGAARAGWAFPLAANLKGYLQFFSGYGYSLIDYNAYQRVLGAGFLLKFR
jgi:phospholipase A1